MVRRSVLLAFVVAACATVASAQQVPPTAGTYAGHYRLTSAARVDAGRVYRRSFRPTLDVQVQALPEPGRLRFEVTVEGRTCRLDGAVSADGRVRFDPGQSCAQHIATPDFRADLAARLTDGSAEFAGAELRLSTRWSADGPVTVASRPGETVQVNGASIISNARGRRQ